MKRYGFIDKSIKFTDVQNVVSVRDGFQEYHTSEIGMEGDKVVKIYRMADAIEQIVPAMVNLPITHNHIDMQVPPPAQDIIGRVKTSLLRPMTDNQYNGTVEIENVIEADLEGIESRELSLGYFAKLEEYKDGFLQSDFQVHHLAIVDAGRCGKSCKFIDAKSFILDYDTILKSNIKKDNPMKEVLELFNKLGAADQKSFVDALGIKPEVKFVDKIKEVPAQVTAKMKKEIVDAGVDRFLDSPAFADTLKKENESYARERVAVIDKAKNFLEPEYNFADKATDAIMADAVAAELSEVKFADHEIPTAFKTLQVPEKQSAEVTFTDAQKEMADLADIEYK